MKFCGLIIAAGYSSRFNGFKPLARIGNETFLSNIFKKIDTFSEHIVIVSGHKNRLIEEHIKEQKLSNSICVHNKNHDKGMSESILIGLQYILNHFPDHSIIYQPVDIPHIAKPTYEKLINRAISIKDKILKPSYNHRGGHPLIIPGIVNKKLISHLKQNDSLKTAIKKSGIKMEYLNTDDIAIIQDIDTPEDLRQLSV